MRISVSYDNLHFLCVTIAITLSMSYDNLHFLRVIVAIRISLITHFDLFWKFGLC